MCRKRGVYLIDDAAQVVGVSVDGRPLGTFGDVGIVSFSQSKTIVAGSHHSGGLLIINNERFELEMRTKWETLRPPPTPLYDVLRFLWKYKFERATEIPDRLMHKLFKRALRGTNHRAQDIGKMGPLVATVALKQLKSLPRRMAARGRVAERYYHNLQRHLRIQFPQYNPGRYLTRIVVSLPVGVDVSEVRADLRRRGTRTRLGYPVYGSKEFVAARTAESVASRLIELPSHAGMPDTVIDRICDSLFAAIQNSGGATAA